MTADLHMTPDADALSKAARIRDLEGQLYVARLAVGDLSRQNHIVTRRRDELLEANNRLLERARGAERRVRVDAITQYAIVTSATIFGAIAAAIAIFSFGGAR